MFSEWVSGIVTWFFMLVKDHGIFSVFFIVILEELLLPIPSPLVIMGAGYILIPAGVTLNQAMWYSLWMIALPAAIASTIGSFFTYGIGYYGGKPMIIRLRRYLRVSWEDIIKSKKHLNKGKKVWIIIAVLRAIPFFPIAIVSLAAGVLRLSWKKYAVATFIGTIPRTFILGLVGWWVGGEFVALANQLSIIENIFVIVVLAAIVYVLYRYRHMYKHHCHRIAKAGKKHVSRILKRNS